MINNHNLYIREGHADAIESLPEHVQEWFKRVYPAFYEDLSWHNDAVPFFHVGNMEDENEVERPIVLGLTGRYDDGDCLIPGWSIFLAEFCGDCDDTCVDTCGMETIVSYDIVENADNSWVWDQLKTEIEQGILGLGTVEQLEAETTINGHEAFDILKGMVR